MIAEDVLRTAAARSSAVYVRYLEQDFDREHQHAFSPQFEKRIKRMCRRANHPFLYKSLQRVASIFLAILLGGAIWLTVDVDARAEFFGWVKSVYENYIVYRFEPEFHPNDSEIYLPTWLPTGYNKVSSDYSGGTAEVRYIGANGQGLIFSYSFDFANANWFFDTSVSVVKQVYVNGTPAELLFSEGPEAVNTIVWTSDHNTVFYISASLPEIDMMRIAESVQKTDQ